MIGLMKNIRWWGFLIFRNMQSILHGAVSCLKFNCGGCFVDSYVYNGKLAWYIYIKKVIAHSQDPYIYVVGWVNVLFHKEVCMHQ